MKIKVISLTEEAVEKRDYRQAVEIEINDRSVFYVQDGESEDSNLSRDFGDVWKIPDLMKQAYEAGKNGEELIIEYEESEEI